MSTAERIFHSILYEALALIIGVTLAALFLQHDKSLLASLGVAFSVIAMVWNYFYNLIFDHLFGQDRIKRTIKIRAAHALCFEFGLLVVTTPVIMWALNLDFISALLMDIGAAIFFTLYTMGFNWVYDLLRHRLYPDKQLA